MTARQIYDDKHCSSFLQGLIYFESKMKKVCAFCPEDFTSVLLVLSYLNPKPTQVLEREEYHR